MDHRKGAPEDFVTVVSVGGRPVAATENFVTVLSIGSAARKAVDVAPSPPPPPPLPMLEEEVQVFRLPGERLGFGLKFEGGNKTSELVRRLFVQSCAEQSPASRAVCSWGSLGEGDEIMSIDDVPVARMTRLDCVRRLKESQLMIKLVVRCRGALRPEVISAELKSSPERAEAPPELPGVPPPVPPRKLRQARGSADGEANPGPAKKCRDAPNGTTIYCGSSGTVSENSSYETCESSSPGNSANGSKNESPKGSPKERSPELTKSKQEPPEAMVYLDARSQDGSSTHGSTSDDTGSSMSTVVDKFSTSDRFSTISTASTASTASVEQQGDVSRNEPVFLFVDRRYGKPARTKDIKVDVNAIRLEGGPFEHHLDREEFPSTPPDSYLLTRLANSEAATYVDSLGEGGIVERVTAVVAPNTVVIEETITLQPPLSFQDAPLSYGHETRPGLFYDDLAADSATHFRPIKDDASIVERVNGRDDALANVCAPRKIPPPLPARNHVNRICVSRENECNDAAVASVPVLPPKPLPRKEARARRKRPPPPPPPLPPPPPPPPTSLQSTTTTTTITTTSPARVADALVEDSVETRDEETRKPGGRVTLVDLRQDAEPISPAGEDRRIDKDAEVVPVNFANAEKPANERVATVVVASRNQDVDPRKTITEEGTTRNLSPLPEDGRTKSEDTANAVVSERTNKVLEIIEMKKAKALSPSKNFAGTYASVEIDFSPEEINSTERSEDREASESRKTEKDETSARMSSESGGVGECAQRNANESAREENESKQRGKLDSPTKEGEAVEDDSERRESERSILNGVNEGEDCREDEDTTDESDGDDYYWQSNLATIGEEEEINSLEYADANDQVTADSEPKIVAANERQPSRGSSPISKDPPVGTNPVDGRMESCVGGQRLPPDGDEFPAAYQEFSAAQQYQFATGSRTMTTTTTLMMTTKGGGESRVFAAGEAFELLPDDETDSGGKTLGKAIPLPDGPIVEVGAEETSETSATVDRRKHRPPEVDETVLLAVDPAVSSNHRDSTRDENSKDRVDASIRPSVVVSEKKIEIAGYYRKDATPLVAEPPKDAEGDEPPPPPLPSTRPPRMSPRETITAKTQQPPLPSQLSQHGSQFSRQPQRKFSSNVGDSWRQDDRSEKSVRDKIAMFSSRSSAEAPLFPSAVPCVSVGRLSKYRSSEDVVLFLEEEGKADRRDGGGTRGPAEKTRSSLDLTNLGPQPAADASVAPPPWKYTRKANVSAYGSRSFDDDRLLESPPPACPPKSAPPPVPRKSVVVVAVPSRPEPMTTGPPPAPEPTPKSPFRFVAAGNDHAATSPRTFPPADATAVGTYTPAASSVVTSPTKTTPPTSLTRATSFSGGNACLHERSRSLCDLPPPSRVARTNSLASAFKRPGEEARKSNLNQLIEQRRRGMSKLRGLVIPEKETLPITAQPIVDLPEIKSRDSILNQMPKVCIQDKWGSQSSLASNASTASVPAKTTHTFKMPPPQILPKYSPAFKRKSLAVYGTNGSASASAGNCSPTKTTASPTSGLSSDAPKSLESICSPTRSDYSFEFASSSGSPDASRSSGLRVPQRKGGAEYDDSDNDSAVSSSQSSISRGFSPPASPVPSERSTISSSERSYLPTESYRRDSSLLDSSLVVASHRAERGRRQYAPRPSMLGSERSSSSGSSVQNPSGIERQSTLQRSSSTDTNCSSSSTLTSGSQASGESLSRRVLKPQSVEAINRKNILASARCRSGRDLNGSPLIQRKFSDEDEDDDDNEAKPMSKLAQENGSYVGVRRASNGRATIDQRNTKIAYIEIAEHFPEEGARRSTDAEIAEKPEECVTAATRRRSSAQLDPTATEIETRPEPSNDLRTWVRAEAKALADSEAEKTRSTPRSPPGGSSQIQTSVLPADTRNGKIATDRDAAVDSNVPELAKPRSRSSLVSTKSEDERPGDLLTVLATRSRSRSAIHVAEDGDGATKSRASLEDILAGRTNASDRFAGNGVATEARQVRRVNSIDSWTGVDGPRPYGSRNVAASLLQDRTRVNGDEDSEGQTKRDPSKIPTVLGKTSSLGRRSASVTDMKKAFEKTEVPTSPSNQPHFGTPTHNRFPSLDSSVEENTRASVATEAAEPDRYCGEQFGSISSLASSTSLISQQELAQLVEEASLLEENKGAHDVIVVLLHKENPTGSVGIALAGGVDCEAKEITVHRVLAHSIADKDGRVQRGDRILSINGRSTRGLSHRESVTVLKQPRSEVVLVVSRNRDDDGCKLRSRTESVETIVEGSEVNGSAEDSTAWGPPSTVAIFKGGAGLGFSLEGGRDSPLGDKPLVIKKIFTGGAAEKTGALKAGDQLLEVNGNDVTRMSRIEAWSFMKKIHDGEVNLLVRHPATKSS